MPSYHITFIGRLVNALGIRYLCERTVWASSADMALLKLYDTHDHISVRTCTELQPPVGIMANICPYCGAAYTIASGGCAASCPQSVEHAARVSEAAKYEELRDPREGEP